MSVLSPNYKAVADAKLLIEARLQKATEKRCRVLAVLLGTDKPLSAYELTEQYNQTFREHIIANSVYRILDWLVVAGVVHRLDVLNKYIACQHEGCTQQPSLSIFVVCQSCQKTIEQHAPDTLRHAIYERVSDTNYRNILPHIELTGVCEACSNSKNH